MSGAADLTPQFLAELEQVAVAAAAVGGELVRDRFTNGFKILPKGASIEHDIVTDADRQAQKIITDTIRQTYPQHAILGEEDDDTPQTATEIVWSIDPIDGTRNFACHAVEFGVSVAALHKGEPVVGAIWTLSHEPPGYKITHARVGGGTRTNSNPHTIEDGTQPSRKRHAMLPPNFVSAYEMQPELVNSPGEIRVVGSVAWEAVALVNNTAQYIVTSVCHHWDVAAAMVIVKEAGGLNLSSDSAGNLQPLVLWNGADYKNDTATFAKMRDWRGNLISAAPNMAHFLQRNLRLVG